MRKNPHLYEINARLFIRRLSKKHHRPVTLATVPEEEWQQLTSRGFDLVWMMGVWKRSPGARRKALLDPHMRQEYSHILPGWTGEDVAGSPYAVYDYSLDPSLGGEDELARLKSQLKRYGIGLVLDFVPNHLAFDHPWTISHPERFVQAKDADRCAKHDWFFQTDGGTYLAHGRDPNFPPWNDTVQVNFYSTDMRRAFIDELLQISEVADGVRCDMAMLALNEVFGKTWGLFLQDYPRPQKEFWAEAIGKVRQRRPDFLFLAEAYWGMERKLQELGFDFTYDKPFYDRLQFSTATDVRGYLRDEAYHQRSARFIENHDEPRAVVAFGRERSLAASVVLATVPGLRLFHNGQLEGRRIRVPVQLIREPEEAPDQQVAEFYQRLLAITDAPVFHDGQWELLEASHAWEGNESCHNLLAWSWRYAGQFKLVVVNYSHSQAQCRLKLASAETTQKIMLRDEMAGVSYLRDPGELRSKGLYIDLAPYKAHLFDVGTET